MEEIVNSYGKLRRTWRRSSPDCNTYLYFPPHALRPLANESAAAIPTTDSRCQQTPLISPYAMGVYLSRATTDCVEGPIEEGCPRANAHVSINPLGSPDAFVRTLS